MVDIQQYKNQPAAEVVLVLSTAVNIPLLKCIVCYGQNPKTDHVTLEQKEVPRFHIFQHHIQRLQENWVLELSLGIFIGIFYKVIVSSQMENLYVCILRWGLDLGVGVYARSRPIPNSRLSPMVTLGRNKDQPLSRRLLSEAETSYICWVNFQPFA